LLQPHDLFVEAIDLLADRQGWATFIGTPKGKNEFWRLYESAKKDPAWFHMMLKASDLALTCGSRR
jgi:phage terminase large subunit